METGITKSSSRKTMRVSIAFTGVACGALAGAPAMAATVQAGRPMLNAIPRTAAITEKSHCPAGTSHWLHMGLSKAADYCFGGKGTDSILDSGATSFCGGNNKGYFYGFLRETGKYETIHFGHGTTYAHIAGATGGDWLSVLKVHISNYSGTDKCPFP